MNYAQPSGGREVGHGPGPAAQFTFTPSPVPLRNLLQLLPSTAPCSATTLLGRGHSVTAGGCLQGLAHASASVQGRPSARQGRISSGGCATAPGGLAVVPEDVFDAWLCTNSSRLKTRAPQASGDAVTAIHLPGKPMQAERGINT